MDSIPLQVIRLIFKRGSKRKERRIEEIRKVQGLQAADKIPDLDLYGEHHLLCISRVAERFPTAKAAKLLNLIMWARTKKKWAGETVLKTDTDTRLGVAKE